MSAEALAGLNEVETENQEPAPPEKVAEIAPEANPIAEKALRIGWRPKEEFEGDPDQWVDAAEFVSRKPLFDQIHSLKKALKDRDSKIDAVSKHASKVEELTRKRTMAEIEQRRDQAVETGDISAFKQADKELREVEQDFKPEPVKSVPEIPEIVQEFAKKHEKWFEKDEDMTDYAVARAAKYAKQGVALGDALPKVEEDIKRAFPHKFANPNKDKAAAVSSNNAERRAKTYGYGDLDDGQKAVWAALKKSGKTLDSYIQELKDLGEIK